MYKQNEKLSQNGSIPTNIEKLALEKGLLSTDTER